MRHRSSFIPAPHLLDSDAWPDPALVWLIAAHAIAIGILLLAAGLSLRRHGERPFEGSPRHA
jgi:hypothetical protein